jgi:hypothetical protein
MRGPLLSGAVGSAVTLRRLCEIVRNHGPTAVVRSDWLGLTLASEIPVVAVLPASARAAARRRRRSKKAGPPSLFALAGAAPPLGEGAAGSLIVTDLSEVDPAGLIAYLLDTAALIRPGGLLVALDRTKDAATEARLAGALLGAGYLSVGQERPREGALLSRGHPPPVAVRTALADAARTPAPAAVESAPSAPDAGASM